MSKVFLVVLFMCISNAAYCQIDTAWIEYKDLEGYIHQHFSKHPKDPHEENYYPFNGSNLFSISIGNKKKGFRRLHFFHASHGPKGNKSPFYYVKVNQETIEKIVFLTEGFFEAATYSDLIRFFKDDNKVIMLYDSRQPPGEEQYIVRVYFDFDRYE